MRYNKAQFFAHDEDMANYLNTQAVRAVEANKQTLIHLSYNAQHPDKHANEPLDETDMSVYWYS